MPKMIVVLNDAEKGCCDSCPLAYIDIHDYDCNFLCALGCGYKDCPLKPYKEAIPIEWFKKEIVWHFKTGTYGAEVYQWVLNRWYEDKEDWEKENERV